MIILKKIGLVLEAGGVKGFCHIATLKIMEEHQVSADIVVGSSAGSIIGALYSLGYNSEKIFKMLSSVVEKNYKKFVNKDLKTYDLIFKASLLQPEDIYPFFKELFGKKKFSDLKIKFAAITFSVDSLESEIIDEGYLVDAIYASSSVPGVFGPLWLGGSKVLDGGVLSPVPVKEAKGLGAEIVLSSVFKGEKRTYSDQYSLLLYLDSIKELMIKRESLELSDFAFEYKVRVSWNEFEKYNVVYTDALKDAEDRRDDFEDFIRRRLV